MNYNETSNHLGSIVNLNFVVRNYQNEQEDLSMCRYLHLLQIVIDGFVELKRSSHYATIETVYLDLDSYNEAVLPADYQDYIAVGINKNGEMWTLTLNDKLIPATLEKCGERIEDLGIGNPPNSGYAFAPHFMGDGRYFSGVYGMGGGTNRAYFKVDRSRNKVIIRGNVPNNQIILEYISTGLKPSGGTLVPRDLVHPLKCWVYWRTKFKPGVPMSERNEALQNLHIACKRLDELNIPTLDEYFDQQRRDSIGVVRR